MNLIELVRQVLAQFPPLRPAELPPAEAVDMLQTAAFEQGDIRIDLDLAETLLRAYALLEPRPYF